MKKETLIVLVLAALAIVLYLVLRPGPQPTQTPPVEVMTEEEVEGVEEKTEADESESNVVSVEVQNEGLTFVPDEITVKKGDTVRITFTNTFGMHDFVIDEFDVRTEVISVGESDTVEFVADQAGEFEYYCDVMNHREMGMFGKLIVEE